MEYLHFNKTSLLFLGHTQRCSGLTPDMWGVVDGNQVACRQGNARNVLVPRKDFKGIMKSNFPLLRMANYGEVSPGVLP